MQKSVDIRRNDQVQVITGRDKGKKGRVLRVMPDKGKVLVEHVMMVKKNVRPNPQKNIKGGIAEQESAITISNVMLMCTACATGRCAWDTKSTATSQCVCARAARRRWRNSGSWRLGSALEEILAICHRSRTTELSSSRTGSTAETVRKVEAEKWQTRRNRKAQQGGQASRRRKKPKGREG